MIKVLLVDDEYFIMQGLAKIVDWEENGFEIVGMAGNGAEALELIRAEHPQLVIADIRMPVMNGLEATKAIRGLNGSWASGIPIIAMTADAFSENVAECMAAGMNGHIAKPVDMKLVLKEIKRIKEETK